MPGDNPHQGPEHCTLSRDMQHCSNHSWWQAQVQRNRAAPPPLPREEGAFRDSGVSSRKGCASTSSKKRTLFPLSIFFFPSGLNPLLERDNYLQGNRLSAHSASSPSPFAVGSFSSKTELYRHHETAPGQENCEHRMLQGNVLVCVMEPGPPWDLLEPAQTQSITFQRPHTRAIREINCVQKSLITQTDLCSLL